MKPEPRDSIGPAIQYDGNPRMNPLMPSRNHAIRRDRDTACVVPPSSHNGFRGSIRPCGEIRLAIGMKDELTALLHDLQDF